jgi:hypothetical protein
MVINIYPVRNVIADTDNKPVGVQSNGTMNSLQVSDPKIYTQLNDVIFHLKTLCVYFNEIVGDDLSQDAKEEGV